jgi:hypothetical protein
MCDFGDDWQACTFEYWSWLHQVTAVDGLVNKLLPRIRMVLQGQPTIIPKVASKQAWWDLSLTSLKKFANYLHIPVAVGSTLFDALYGMIAATLPELSESEILDIVHIRAVHDNVTAATPQALHMPNICATCWRADVVV